MKIEHFKYIVEANFFNLGKPYETNFKEQFSKKLFFLSTFSYLCVITAFYFFCETQNYKKTW